MSALDEAVRSYRDTATAQGLIWQDGVAPSEGDTALAARIFGVVQVRDDVVRLYTLMAAEALVLPEAGYLVPWPTSSEALVDLTASIGTPFPWRHQMPVFNFDHIFYTVVLLGPHAGEVWRYEIDPDALEGTVRAAPDLAALFRQWTDGVAAGMIRCEAGIMMLDRERLGSPADSSAARFRDATPPLDMRAFPESVMFEPDLPAWQRECSDDPDGFDDAFETLEALQDEVATVRRELGA